MQQLITLFSKSFRYFYNRLRIKLNTWYSITQFYTNNVKFKNIISNGIPYVMVARGGNFKIGKNFQINNGIKANPIGRGQPCIFVVDKNATLTIGSEVGMSQTAIVCHYKVSIGNRVKIGGGVCIYDTDFHSLDPLLRRNSQMDRENKVNKEVIINDDVFIGAHSTILKGVIIGKKSVVGSCSVVTKSIPPNEIWAGNPAKFIRKI